MTGVKWWRGLRRPVLETRNRSGWKRRMGLPLASLQEYSFILLLMDFQCQRDIRSSRGTSDPDRTHIGKSWKCRQIRHVAATQVGTIFRPLQKKPFGEGRDDVLKMFSPARIFPSRMCVDAAAVFLHTSLDKPSLSIFNGRNSSLALLTVRTLCDTIERRL